MHLGNGRGFGKCNVDIKTPAVYGQPQKNKHSCFEQSFVCMVRWLADPWVMCCQATLDHQSQNNSQSSCASCLFKMSSKTHTHTHTRTDNSSLHTVSAGVNVTLDSRGEKTDLQNNDGLSCLISTATCQFGPQAHVCQCVCELGRARKNSHCLARGFQEILPRHMEPTGFSGIRFLSCEFSPAFVSPLILRHCALNQK